MGVEQHTSGEGDKAHKAACGPCHICDTNSMLSRRCSGRGESKLLLNKAAKAQDEAGMRLCLVQNQAAGGSAGCIDCQRSCGAGGVKTALNVALHVSKVWNGDSANMLLGVCLGVQGQASVGVQASRSFGGRQFNVPRHEVD